MVFIEISKKSENFSIWDEKRIKGAFHFGNGTIKDFRAYMRDNKAYCTFITNQNESEAFIKANGIK